MNKFYVTLFLTWVILFPSLIATFWFYLMTFKELRQNRIGIGHGRLSERKKTLAKCFGSITVLYFLCYLPFALLECARLVTTNVNQELGINGNFDLSPNER